MPETECSKHIEKQNPAPPDDGEVDVTLIRWMLSLSHADRLRALQGWLDAVAQLRDARLKSKELSE
jgi:hypothetical protein